MRHGSHTRLARLCLAGLLATTAACSWGRPSSCAASHGAGASTASGARALRSSSQLSRALSKLPFRESTGASNLSDATALDEETLLVVSDEGLEVALLDPQTGQSRVIDLARASPVLQSLSTSTPLEELDLEGVASVGHNVFITGSASLKRKKPKAGKDNAERLASVLPSAGEHNAHANLVLAFRTAGQGAATELRPVHAFDVRAVLLSLPLLAPFAQLPSKDNGIDVEGLAADDAHLYFGLRGPVLRGHALVLRTDHRGAAPRLSWLHLEGLGIRAITRRPQGGFWLLAGPTMDLDAAFALFAWDGETSVFDVDTTPALSKLLDLPHARDRKPEGLFLHQDTLCVLHDGPQGGDPMCMALPK